jgi:hypothetical protein
MTKSLSVFVWLTALLLTMSFAFPADDAPETSYDESESLPYENTPVVSITRTETIAQAPAAWHRISRRFRDPLRRPRPQHLHLARRRPFFIPDSLTILGQCLRC